MKTISYGKQHISDDDINAVIETLRSDFLTQGPKVAEFEEAFAKYVGAKYAVAVANGTAALHLSCLALNVNEESKVITTPITFAASANCVLYCGGEVVFADVDDNNILLDVEHVKRLLESSPQGTYQGIIPVDFAGYPVNLEALRKLADKYGLWIIEDACHAPGGYFVDSNKNKQHCGNGKYADLAVFSFHPVKHITTGEGGMITTNDKVLYDKLAMLRTHGITKKPELMYENHGGWYYEMQMLGFNYRLPDLNAALGLSQLLNANKWLIRRQEIAMMYNKAFEGKVKIIKPNKNEGHAYHLYVIQVNNRKMLYDRLKECGIYTQVHYIPVHTLPYYQSLGYKKKSLPKAEKYYQQCLSLPIYPTMANSDVEYIIENVLKGIQ